MSVKAIHMNLLREAEVQSSSPIRLRVMLPVAMMLLAASMVMWWVIVYGAILLNTTAISSLKQEIDSKQAGHQRVLDQMAEAGELELQLEQLDCYRRGRREWGEALAHVAEIIPLKVQLTRLAIPPPPPQNLLNPANPKLPPLWGPLPAERNERVTLTLAGRTTKETPVISMMESLESETFTNSLVICRDPRVPEQSPRVKSFRQEAVGSGGQQRKPRMLAFEIEYTAKERSF